MLRYKKFLRAAAILLLPILLLSGFSFSAFAEEYEWQAIANLAHSVSVEEDGTLAVGVGSGAFETVEDSLGLACKSAILMEAKTGAVLYVQNADEALPPASVTKVMTLLLVMEAIDAGRIGLDDTVTVSERAASMGGSQIFLKVGEQMSVEDMLKSVIIASANDAACALAEFVSGSEEAFVKQMNARAAELGMKNTRFENTNGLDDTVEEHLTSARDIALMSAELIKHEKILEYSKIWMDSVRGGAFTLTNTNRLVRFYKGCTGLKTGSTGKAGFCVSATAERDGMTLIAVIMGAESGNERNAAAASLLDWGFANYALYSLDKAELDGIRVTGGERDGVSAIREGFCAVVPKGSLSRVEAVEEISGEISAPVSEGDVIGRVIFKCDGKEIGRSDVCAAESIPRIGFFSLWRRMLEKMLLK